MGKFKNNLKSQTKAKEPEIKPEPELELKPDSEPKSEPDLDPNSKPDLKPDSSLKSDLRQKMHIANVDWPWLKVVLGAIFGLFVLVGASAATLQWAREAQPADDPSQGGIEATSEGQGTEETPENEEEPKEPDEAETPAEEPEPPVAETPEPEQPTTPAPPSQPEAPAATGNNQGGVAVVPPARRPDVEVPAGRKLIALTFDDGPSTVTTPRLLDILAQKGVKATFFVVGSMAQRAPDLVRREEAEGHEVGSHSPWHDNLATLGAAAIRSQAATMNQIFMDILGHGPAFTRPPYGAVSQAVRDNLGQPLISWSIDPLDWKYRNAATVRYNVVSAAHDGAIILVHDIHASTIDAIPGIIDDLRAQGYEFLTVSELAQARGVALVNGVLYYSFRP